MQPDEQPLSRCALVPQSQRLDLQSEQLAPDLLRTFICVRFFDWHLRKTQFEHSDHVVDLLVGQGTSRNSVGTSVQPRQFLPQRDQSQSQ